MFAAVRHTGYHIGTGLLTPEGRGQALALAAAIRAAGEVWKEVRTSPTARTRETAAIIAQELGIPVVEDVRIGVHGDLSDLLPPTEPSGIIFVSHLPVLSRMFRAWSKEFGLEEPSLTDIAAGCLVLPEAREIRQIHG
ncbi:MAG: histidine phosphatase family protein [Candidatus Uhrbacteria bacterium]|nr:histidine phosphatase family protein [Candidatus Uhrbacteria bacterium]